MASKRKHRLETIATHAGTEPEPTTGAVTTPIFYTSTYAQESPGVHKGYEYSRTQNPTREALEAAIAALEDGPDGAGKAKGVAFASGLAATATLLHLWGQGDHVVMCDDVYGGTYRLFDKVLRKNGFDFTSVDMTDPENVKKAIKPNTKAIWIETPTNPLLKIVDLREISRIAKERSVVTIVDNTFATPVFQRPLELGIDVVLHSTTKYLNGHADVVGGAIALRDDALYTRLKFLQNAMGAVPSPMDCFLTLRGLRTLVVRMERHEANATKIARWLSTRKEAAKVIYPGLESHPGHAVAKKQMHGFGGMVSVDLAGGFAAAKRFMEKIEIFTCAESLGGFESLANHPAIMTHASVEPEKRRALGITDGLVRLSVGIENADDLIADLEAAL
jgi:cystathionine gamma-lyase